MSDYPNPLPREGWSGPDDLDRMFYVIHGRKGAMSDAPKLPGWEAYFVAVHGDAFTRWTYQRSDVPEEAPVLARIIIVTKNSVYTAVRTRLGVSVTGRATWNGAVLPASMYMTGPSMSEPKVGSRFYFSDPNLGVVSTSNVVQVIELAVE